MRMRIKAWAEPELLECPFYAADAKAYKGRWAELFAKAQPLHLEIGCGKGVSTCEQVYDNQDVNLLAIDEVKNVLGCALRNIYERYGEQKPENVALTVYDAKYISDILAPEDGVERIYINFCNPWTEKHNHVKRRLTHPRQLAQYRQFLQPGGEIWFKTDDDTLFNDSLHYFERTGFELIHLSRDLHADGFTPNYESEYEKKYMAKDVPIKLAIVRMTDWNGELYDY